MLAVKTLKPKGGYGQFNRLLSDIGKIPNAEIIETAQIFLSNDWLDESHKEMLMQSLRGAAERLIHFADQIKTSAAVPVKSTIVHKAEPRTIPVNVTIVHKAEPRMVRAMVTIVKQGEPHNIDAKVTVVPARPQASA